MNKNPWLTIIGINGDDINTLPQKAIQSIKCAELIMGAKRHLKIIQLISKKTVHWPSPFEEGIQKLLNLRGKKIVVLVSGNAFWYGAGSVLAEKLDLNEWICFQSPSTFSLAASKIGWAIQDTLCFGLHSAPLETIRPYLAPKIKFIILLKDGSKVIELAEWLSLQNFGESDLFIMESLGFKDERLRHTKANKLNFYNIDHPVCVGIIISGDGLVLPLSSGKPDIFFKNDGQMTKQPIRALTMSALAPKPFEHLWDIGSGSGSISIEWLLTHKTNSVSAIECKSSRVKQIKLSANKLGLSNLFVYEGKIQNILNKLKKPDVVFIGGGLTNKLLTDIWETVPKSTRIIINSVTLETTSILIKAQKKYGGSLQKIELSNITKLGNKRTWSKNYPIIQWVVVK